jgi:hypothetical protein
MHYPISSARVHARRPCRETSGHHNHQLILKGTQCCPKASLRRVPRSVYEEALARAMAKTEAFERPIAGIRAGSRRSRWKQAPLHRGTSGRKQVPQLHRVCELVAEAGHRRCCVDHLLRWVIAEQAGLLVWRTSTMPVPSSSRTCR